MKSRIASWLSSFSITSIFLIAIDSAARADFPSFRGTAMGMGYSVKFGEAMTNETLEIVRESVRVELDKIESIFSLYRTDSELSRWNQFEDSDSHPVSNELLAVSKIAIAIASITDGSFDPTVRPLVDLWGFERVSLDWKPPSDNEIRDAMANIGFQKVEIDEANSILRKKIPGLKLDLNSVVEGFALESLARNLEGQGFQDFLVELGGEYLARGKNGGEVWTIGIENPSNPRRLSMRVGLEGEVLCVSGNYRQTRSVNNQNYSHILDAKTGWPVDSAPRSVAVIARRGELADAWATALMTLSRERAIQLMESESIQACIIGGGDDSEIIVSPAGLERFQRFPSITNATWSHTRLVVTFLIVVSLVAGTVISMRWLTLRCE